MREHLRFLKARCEEENVQLSFFFCGLKKRKDGHDNWKLAQKRVNARAKEIFAKLKEKAHSSKIPNPHRSATVRRQYVFLGNK